MAPNIYYLGYSGVVQFGGLRIAGVSGIYNHHHYHLGHFERPPFDNSMLTSAYHVRSFEVFKLKQVSTAWISPLPPSLTGPAPFLIASRIGSYVRPLPPMAGTDTDSLLIHSYLERLIYLCHMTGQWKYITMATQKVF